MRALLIQKDVKQRRQTVCTSWRLRALLIQKDVREEGAKEEIDLFPALKEYYTHHMKDGTFVSWLAFDGENIVGTSGMSFVEKPPYFGCPTGKIGLLSSMFTNPDYRRKGIAKELLSRVVNDAREYGCGTVQITASAAEPSTQLLLSECRKSIAKSTYGAGKTAASTAVKAAGTARKISFLSTAAGKAVIGIVATASIASAVTVGVISYNKSNDKNATAQENVPAVEEVPVNADQPIDGVVEDTETTDAPEDENGSEKYADIPESVLPSSVRNDKDYFEFWDEPVKATCWIDGVKGTIYADWDKTQIIKEVTYDVDGYEDELLIIGSTLDGGTHAIAIYNGQYVVVNDAMWDHWYNGKSSAFD